MSGEWETMWIDVGVRLQLECEAAALWFVMEVKPVRRFGDGELVLQRLYSVPTPRRAWCVRQPGSRLIGAIWWAYEQDCIEICKMGLTLQFDLH